MQERANTEKCLITLWGYRAARMTIFYDYIIIQHFFFRTNLAVHVVLSLDQLASVHLSRVGLAGHDVSLCLMQDFDWYSDGHISTIFLEEKEKWKKYYNGINLSQTCFKNYLYFQIF